MNQLCLTLGHNSSAVLVPGLDGKLIGYENERLTRIKSDSAFPLEAIREIYRHAEDKSYPGIIYISHWFDNFDPYTTECKYYSARVVTAMFPESYLIACTPDGVSHHDAHAFSAQAFAGPEFAVSDALTVVVDGFGTGQEVASVYRGKTLTARVTHYFFSMGLLYQHAAEACGMDGINDVYKFLGYRTHLHESDLDLCKTTIERILCLLIHTWARRDIDRHILVEEGLYDVSAFLNAKAFHKSLFDELQSDDRHRTRCRVGYVVQEILETCVISLIESQGYFSKLILAGGCFYNVRLNGKIRDTFTGASLCVMPLAGDQGAALGLLHSHVPLKETLFDDLCWGPREFPDAKELTDDTIANICHELANGAIVNVCYGAMEFGPRALCHTSSLALPLPAFADAINRANGRTSVMPMAPVMLREHAYKYFRPGSLNRTHKSDKYMITAHGYLESVVFPEVEGAALKDLDGTFSGRPQLVDPNDKFIGPLLTHLSDFYDIEVLINTSLNVHGEPIVFDTESLQTTMDQWTDCPLRFTTHILKERSNPWYIK